MTSIATLKDVVIDYIDENKALGYKFEHNEKTLYRLVKQADQKGYTLPQLPRELVEFWCEKNPHEKDSNHQNRVSIVRNLAKYMNRLGYSAYIHNYKGKINRDGAYNPYIFNNDELRKIFLAAEEVRNTKSYPFRSNQMTLIFKTFYSTGMRSNELVNLKKDDVNLTLGILHIYETKFNKERFIPIDEVLLRNFRDYDRYMCEYLVWKDAKYFFINSLGRKHKDIYHPYRQILNLAGLSHGGRGKGPRVHDFSYPNLNKIQTF